MSRSPTLQKIMSAIQRCEEKPTYLTISKKDFLYLKEKEVWEGTGPYTHRLLDRARIPNICVLGVPTIPIVRIKK